MAQLRYMLAARDLPEEMFRKLEQLEGAKIPNFFIPKLGPSQVYDKRSSTACVLVIPSSFVNVYKEKLDAIYDKDNKSIFLRSTSSSSTVYLKKYGAQPGSKSAHLYKFGKGWREFAYANHLLEGDGLIFEGVKGWSEAGLFEHDTPEFCVHVYHAIGKIPVVAIPSFDSELSHKNHGPHDSSGGCSTHQHLFGGRGDHNSLDLQDNYREGMLAKKRKVGEEASASAFQCTVTPQSLSIKLYLPESANAQMKPHGFQVIRQPPFVHQPPKVSLPSFIHGLVDYNVMDAAGNSSGARFDVPLSFLKTYNIQLNAIVKLEGIREGSSYARNVTCSYDMLQESEGISTKVLSSLGWGDFVRDNDLKAGQELVFTLASDSFFVVREVAEIVIYTK